MLINSLARRAPLRAQSLSSNFATSTSPFAPSPVPSAPIPGTPLPATPTPPTVTASIPNHTSPTSTLDDTLCSDTPLIFDTHKLIAYLRTGGFSNEQSQTISEAMVRISQHATRHQTGQMVTKSEFSSLRSELSILEKADFALLKTDINAIEKRMETSVAEIYTAVERVENRVIKWVIAVAGAIGLAIVRLTTTSPSSAQVEQRPVRPPSNVVAACEQAARKKGLQVLVT